MARKEPLGDFLIPASHTARSQHADGMDESRRQSDFSKEELKALIPRIDSWSDIFEQHEKSARSRGASSCVSWSHYSAEHSLKEALRTWRVTHKQSEKLKVYQTLSDKGESQLAWKLLFRANGNYEALCNIADKFMDFGGNVWLPSLGFEYKSAKTQSNDSEVLDCSSTTSGECCDTALEGSSDGSSCEEGEGDVSDEAENRDTSKHVKEFYDYIFKDWPCSSLDIRRNLMEWLTKNISCLKERMAFLKGITKKDISESRSKRLKNIDLEAHLSDDEISELVTNVGAANHLYEELGLVRSLPDQDAILVGRYIQSYYTRHDLILALRSSGNHVEADALYEAYRDGTRAGFRPQ